MDANKEDAARFHNKQVFVFVVVHSSREIKAVPKLLSDRRRSGAFRQLGIACVSLHDKCGAHF